MHASLRRVEEWQHDRHGMRALRAAHGREWLALVEHWRAEPDVPALFAADPRRTDLALFDPHARTLVASERWTVQERPFLAGIRPGNADAYSMRPPGWMLDKGWALTAEVAGVTARDGLGPYVQPSTAWIRARASDADLVLGGRQVGGAAPARLTLSLPDRVVATWDIAPGFFFRHLALPAGSLAGSGYLPLRVSASAADGSGRGVDVKLEQFDLQSGGNVMFGYVDGWYEPEYNPTTSLAWHWMSEKARLWVRPVGRDVTLVITGESPRKYFDAAPEVRILAGRGRGRAIRAGRGFLPADHRAGAGTGGVGRHADRREQSLVHACATRRVGRSAPPGAAHLFGGRAVTSARPGDSRCHENPQEFTRSGDQEVSSFC